MVYFEFGPQWFRGLDIAIDIVGIVTLFALGIFSFQLYKMKKERCSFWISMAFFIIALSFMFKILTNFTIYYHVLETRQFGFMTFEYKTVHSSYILQYIGLVASRLLMLVGLYTLYSAYQKNQSKITTALVLYFIIVLNIFIHQNMCLVNNCTSPYYLFYLTSLILLVMITHHYIMTFKKTLNNNTLLLAAGFGIIAVSQAFFMFIHLSPALYVVGEFIQMIGYVLLLATLILVFRHGKKKVTFRNH